MRDNRHVLDVSTEQRRISPLIIVSRVWPERPTRSIAARLILGLSIAIFELLTWLVWWGALPAALFAVLTGTAAAWSANGSTALHLWAELCGRRPTRTWSGDGSNAKRTAAEITAGLWVYSAADHEGRLALHSGEVARITHRYEQDRAHWLAVKAAYDRAVTAGDRPAEDLPPEPVMPALPKEPKQEFIQVVAIRDEQNGVIELAWRGRDAAPSATSSDARYYYCVREKTKTSAQDMEAARALQDLMRALPLNDDETTLLGILTEGGHSETAVKRALRGALAWGLIERRRSWQRTACELVTLFRLPHPRTPRRVISLTGSGDAWASADARHRG